VNENSAVEFVPCRVLRYVNPRFPTDSFASIVGNHPEPLYLIEESMSSTTIHRGALLVMAYLAEIAKDEG
jgi:hypothetical protein